jgi:CheY-like chemotaxis protein
MPDMSGLQVLQAKNQDPALQNIPVVLISARDPMGQPIVSDFIAVTRGGGLSMQQVLACIQSLSKILAAAG